MTGYKTFFFRVTSKSTHVKRRNDEPSALFVNGRGIAVVYLLRLMLSIYAVYLYFFNLCNFVFSGYSALTILGSVATKVTRRRHRHPDYLLYGGLDTPTHTHTHTHPLSIAVTTFRWTRNNRQAPTSPIRSLHLFSTCLSQPSSTAAPGVETGAHTRIML